MDSCVDSSAPSSAGAPADDDALSAEGARSAEALRPHHDRDALQDLVELHELGANVRWPEGMDLRAARTVLATPPSPGRHATTLNRQSGGYEEAGEATLEGPDLQRPRTRSDTAKVSSADEPLLLVQASPHASGREKIGSLAGDAPK